MKLGTPSLVLRLIEHDMTVPSLRFSEDLFRVSRRAGEDLRVRTEYVLTCGKVATITEVQQALVDAAKQLSKDVALPAEELEILAEWDNACADVTTNPDLLCKRVECVMKLRNRERNSNNKFLTC